MNNKLSDCFSPYKPVLPVVSEIYEIPNPVFHLPVINHKFAEQSLKYCLIRQLNIDHCFNIIVAIISCSCNCSAVLFKSFNVYLKNC